MSRETTAFTFHKGGARPQFIQSTLRCEYTNIWTASPRNWLFSSFASESLVCCFSFQIYHSTRPPPAHYLILNKVDKASSPTNFPWARSEYEKPLRLAGNINELMAPGALFGTMRWRDKENWKRMRVVANGAQPDAATAVRKRTSTHIRKWQRRVRVKWEQFGGKTDNGQIMENQFVILPPRCFAVRLPPAQSFQAARPRYTAASRTSGQRRTCGTAGQGSKSLGTSDGPAMTFPGKSLAHWNQKHVIAMLLHF